VFSPLEGHLQLHEIHIPNSVNIVMMVERVVGRW